MREQDTLLLIGLFWLLYNEYFLYTCSREDRELRAALLRITQFPKDRDIDIPVTMTRDNRNNIRFMLGCFGIILGLLIMLRAARENAPPYNPNDNPNNEVNPNRLAVISINENNASATSTAPVINRISHGPTLFNAHSQHGSESESESESDESSKDKDSLIKLKKS